MRGVRDKVYSALKAGQPPSPAIVMVDIADAAMGIAVASTLKPDEDMTTIELKMSFMRPHIKGRLVAEGTIAKRGRRIAFTEAVLTNTKKEVLAKCSGTWLIMTA